MRKIQFALAALLVFVAGSVRAQVDDKAQAVIDNIMTRTSVRAFEEKPVEAEKVETLLRAAMAAPTDRNMQPWHFVVLNTPETVARFYGDGERAERLRKTPLVIVVCADTARMQQGEIRDIWIQDVSAATENLLLAAHALGLGAVWTTIHPLAEKAADVQKRLGLPHGRIIPLCAVRIGYPRTGDSPRPSHATTGTHPHGGTQRSTGPKDKWDPAKITYGLWKE